MNVPEYWAKSLIDCEALRVPKGRLIASVSGAREAIGQIGAPVAVKAQIPSGKRGKAGGIRFAANADDAEQIARDLLGTELLGHIVGKLLIEPRIEIARELYAAVLTDNGAKSPLVLFSAEGGIDIEEVNAANPERIVRRRVDINAGFRYKEAESLIAAFDFDAAQRTAIASALVALYEAYRRYDAQLIEINPLVIAGDGRLWALDCKLVIDDSARKRQAELFDRIEAEVTTNETALERRARGLGLYYIELDGDVGVLANGAGLTMTTIDAIAHYGGSPANFLEIGGEAYTKATAALELVLSNPRVKSVIVNFCGAFARTDVMAEGVAAAVETLEPTIPMFFSIHGTGEDLAIPMVRERLGIEPYDVMDDAVKAAIAATRESARVG